MKYTKGEARYFYWHCRTAALLLEGLEERNTATSSHIQRAIRMATETAVGKRGVQYASRRAFEQKLASRKDWSGLGFTREHVVPVSVIARRVIDLHDSGTQYSWRELGCLTQDDRQHWNVIESDYFLDQAAPFCAVTAMIVRKSAILAWITREEDRELKRNGMTKAMPPDHGGDELARYKFCGIELVPLLPALAA